MGILASIKDNTVGAAKVAATTFGIGLAVDALTTIAKGAKNLASRVFTGNGNGSSTNGNGTISPA